MAQAEHQDLPFRKSEKEGWSFKRVAKVFTPIVKVAGVFAVIDTVGALCMLIITVFIGVDSLVGRDVPLQTYFLAPLFSLIHVFEKEALLKYQILPNCKKDVQGR